MSGKNARKSSGKRTADESFLGRVLLRLKKQKIVRAGDRVGVAVSGGADSLALLTLLVELREKLGIVLSVAHFNHKMRGRASDADEKFVAKLAAKHRLDFHSVSLDVAKKAKKEHANLEETARRARYDYFHSLVEAGICTRVAVAHTADDQAETVLAHLMRGTGLAGLGGIHPVAGSIIRPLLSFRRNELRAYLRAVKQGWREDRTNRDTRRMRARIRKKLLPLLEKEFQPAIVEHLTTLADLAREDESFFEAAVKERINTVAQKNDGKIRITAAELLASQIKGELNAETVNDTEDRVEKDSMKALSKRVVRQIVEDVKQRGGQLGAGHVEAVLELSRARQNGGSISLPGGVEVRKEQNALIFLSARKALAKAAAKEPREFAYPIELTRGSLHLGVPELGCAFRFRVIDWPAKRGETSKDVAVLDRDRLGSPLVLRNWHPGDRMRPAGHRSAKKLKRLLNEKHVNRWERSGWPVLTSGGVLAWARGLPVAAEYAADEGTRAGIVITEEPI